MRGGLRPFPPNRLGDIMTKKLARPRILCDWLYDTDQDAHEPLSESHLLAEAEHLMDNMYVYEFGEWVRNPMYEDYHGNSVRALER